MDHAIRKAELKDMTKLVELCQKHATFEQADFNSAGKVELLTKALFCKTPRLFCFMIESTTEIMGYFTYTIDFSTWDAQMFLHLDCLYLDPEFRRLGIGEKVVEKLRIIAREKNCVNIQFQTPAFNENAIKFYRRIGAKGKEKIRFILM